MAFFWNMRMITLFFEIRFIGVGVCSFREGRLEEFSDRRIVR